jgi:GNAT superfamily N-acetyltransferase
VLLTRATRHDRSDIEQLLRQEGWPDVNLGVGTAFIARDGAVVGFVRVIEVGPGVLVTDDTLVRSDRRRQGIGGRLLQVAMSSTGGTIYVDSNRDAVSLYERAGFRRVSFDDLPSSVVSYYESIGDLPVSNPADHVYMRAR